MEGSNFIFDSVQLIYYKCHEVNFRLGGSYIDYPEELEKKRSTINPTKKMVNVFNMQLNGWINSWRN